MGEPLIMLRQMYFIRRCEDNVFRIFRCYVDLDKRRAMFYLYNCKYRYIQKNGELADDGKHIIYFNNPEGVLSMTHQHIYIDGLVEKDEKKHGDSYIFYFEKEFIKDYQNVGLGNP